LYRKYRDKGLRILAFPANDFGEQEPGPNADIKVFCQKNFDVSFDMFAKIAVKGEHQAPLYKFLTEHPNESVRGEVLWNFQKYLVGPDGEVIARFGPRTEPGAPELIAAIEAALATMPKP